MPPDRVAVGFEGGTSRGLRLERQVSGQGQDGAEIRSFWAVTGVGQGAAGLMIGDLGLMIESH